MNRALGTDKTFFLKVLPKRLIVVKQKRIHILFPNQRASSTTENHRLKNFGVKISLLPHLTNPRQNLIVIYSLNRLFIMFKRICSLEINTYCVAFNNLNFWLARHY